MNGADEVFVGADARELVYRDYDAIPPDELPLWERGRALKTLGTECDSWTRLAGGVAAWTAGVLGAAGFAAVLWSDAPLWARLAGIVAGATLLTVAFRLGRRVWLAGRKVIDTFCWWTLLPERLPEGGAGVEGWRSTPALDAVAARVFVFEGWRVVRLVAAALAFVAPFAFLVSLQDSPRFHPTWQEGQGLAIALFAIIVASISLTTAMIVIWGQFRAARAHAERDPIQRWILRRDR